MLRRAIEKGPSGEPVQIARADGLLKISVCLGAGIEFVFVERSFELHVKVPQ
jgi:hypothetical protein